MSVLRDNKEKKRAIWCAKRRGIRLNTLALKEEDGWCQGGEEAEEEL